MFQLYKYILDCHKSYFTRWMEWEAIYRVLRGINSGKKDYLSNSEGPRKTHSYLTKRLMHISGEIKHDNNRNKQTNK